MPDGERPVIGVDVGGTKVAAARVADGEACDEAVEQTRRDSAEHVLEVIEGAIGRVRDSCGEPRAIGIGVPSQVDAASGTVLSSVNIPLEGISVAEEISSRFGGVPVFVDNDANCAALAEAKLRTPDPLRFLVMYTLGTGVGGGVVIEGGIYHGATGLGGELGHVVVQADGPECPGNCPNHGCLEALCSGTALERDARELARERSESPLGRRAGERDGELRGQDVVELADEGDRDALDLFERLGMWLGVGLAGAINTFEPELIAIGGGLSHAARHFLARAKDEAFARALPRLAERVAIDCAQSGADAGMVGAGLLAMDRLSSEE